MTNATLDDQYPQLPNGDESIPRLTPRKPKTVYMTTAGEKVWRFERSSGYAGWRNVETGEWVYDNDHQRNADKEST